MKENLFLKSALTEYNPNIKTEEVIEWLKDRNEKVHVKVSRITFEEMRNWNIDKVSGSIRHNSGKFFSIDGISVQTNWGSINEWQQPIINQPEIGILGILTKEINGILYFLLQAKIEPGNMNNVQLSPTLQATKSNYTQVHKGRKPLYLEYFQDYNKHTILLDQLQSEQGARFIKKRNRNIIIKVNNLVSDHPDFIWLTLGQIKRLVQIDNLVNMDTRTVISGIPFGSYDSQVIEFYSTLLENQNKNGYNRDLLKSSLIRNNSLYTIDEILNWFTNLKSQYDLNIEKVSLFDIKDWIVKKNEVIHRNSKYFKVIAVEIEIGNREVITWHQPLIKPMQEGLIAFIIKKINGIYHLLVQAKLECGNFDILEFAPTVQCLTGNYRETPEKALPFLEYVLNIPRSQIRFDTHQSEEGGRFYKEQNRNMIVEADDYFPTDLPNNYIWMTLNQAGLFLKFNNYLNIQARSLISAISFI